MQTNTVLYADDFWAWTQETARHIREGKWYDLDPDALAEEVESLGKSTQRELEHRWEVLVIHLLKWRYQPGKRRQGTSWSRTIHEQRRRLQRLLRQSPSLRAQLPAVHAESYAYSRTRASLDTHLPLETWPATCPWSVAEILDDAFWPEAAPPA